MKRILLLAVAVLLPLAAHAQVSFGNAQKFNEGWELSLESGEWHQVTLPHDWSVKGALSPDNASCTGYLPAGRGVYRKVFNGSDLPEAEEYYIYFEGVYNRSEVFLNGNKVGGRPNGFISYMCDLTPYINREGKNTLLVTVDHSRIADSRWYTGSGIYRDCWLVTAGSTHFSQWGVWYTAEDITDSSALITVHTIADGMNGAETHTIRATLRDATGAIVARSSAMGASEQDLTLKLSDPHRWSLSDPYLYDLTVEILKGGRVIDATSMKAGLRTLQFDPDKGFALNGEWMKIKGVCLHHDAGVLGAAVPDEVLETRLLNLKALGVNAIRTSHNPQSPAFYDLCDRLGLLVMDEAFDEWEFPKRKWVEGWNVGTPAYDGTHDFFYSWCDTDVRDMVRRDRNHPSIFMWSIGNEVDYPNDPYSHPVLDGGNDDFTQPAFGGYKPDAPDAMRIGKIAQRLAAVVREEDSSRPVTGALAGVVMSNQTAYPEAVDVVGYNYTESRYVKDHETYPERVIYGSENKPGYGPWTAVRDNPHIFGLFLWTGTDYLGESHAWPSRGFGSGLLDFTNSPKPRGWFQAALFLDEPVCWLGTSADLKDTIDAWDDWNYTPGQTVRVFCYTNAASAELLLNGSVIGERRQYDAARGMISWDVPYSPGVLSVKAYGADGSEWPAAEIATPASAQYLRVSVDRNELNDKGAVAQVLVEVVDENGRRSTDSEAMIACSIEGPGELLGLESGSNTDMSDWTDAEHAAFRGRLVAYIRATEDGGTITVGFSSPQLQGGAVNIKVK